MIINFFIKIICLLIPIKKLRKLINNKLTNFFNKYNYYTLRAKLNCEKIGKNLNLNFNNKTVFNKNTIIGNNCSFNGLVVYNEGRLEIGNNICCSNCCKILTANHNYEGTRLPFDNTKILKNVSIGNNVWIGMNVIILPGTIIEDGVIIQAGSVVHGLIPKYAIAGGNPANVFRYRNIQHYDTLEHKQLEKK